jgi:hypothetical protein
MRNLFISILILFLLTACLSPQGGETSAPQASEVSTTSTPTETPTATAAPTASATPTEVVAPAEFDPGFKYQYEEKIVTTLVSGNQIDLTLATGAELTTISSFRLNKGWESKYGLTPEQGLATFALRSCYRAWVENGENKGTFNDYAELHRIAQESGKIEDWMKVAITAPMNDLTTEAYDPKQVTMLPFYIDKGATLPENVKPFTRMEIVMTKVKSSNDNKLLITDKYVDAGGPAGWGVSLAPDGVLYGHVAVPTIVVNPKISASRIPVNMLSYFPRFFVSGSPNLRSDQHFFDGGAASDFAFKVSQYDWNAAFQTYGPGGKLSEPEKKYNP